MDNIVIKKGINCLLSDGKSAAKSMYYFHSRSVNIRKHSLKLTLKFRYGTFSHTGNSHSGDNCIIGIQKFNIYVNNVSDNNGLVRLGTTR